MPEKYELRLLNPDGQVLKIFSMVDLLNMRYERLVNSVGKFAATFELNQIRDVLEYLLLPKALDYFLEVYRLNRLSGLREKEETYLLRLSHRYYQGNVEYLTIGAVSLNHLILRRVIDPDDDSRAAGGYVSDAGLASRIIKDLCAEHMGELADIARQIPNLTIAADSSGYTAGGRWRYDNLLDVLQDLAVKGQIQFRIERSTRDNLLLHIGSLATDRSASHNYPNGDYTLFTPLRGNLNEPSLSLDYQKQANYVYVRGGSDTNKSVVKMSGDGITLSRYNRIEFAITAKRDEGSDPLYQITEGTAALADKLPEISFDFPFSDDRGGARYKHDWDLGDLVSARWGDYQIDIRINRIEVSVEPNSDSTRVTVQKLP